MRAALRRLGAPEDLVQSVERPSIPLARELMAVCDLTIATGGPAMVKAAYSSGKPAYGVGPGNATMVIDETANSEEAARNARISKTNDHGSGCSADVKKCAASHPRTCSARIRALRSASVGEMSACRRRCRAEATREWIVCTC